jgi:hypothetical protein
MAEQRDAPAATRAGNLATAPSNGAGAAATVEAEAVRGGSELNAPARASDDGEVPQVGDERTPQLDLPPIMLGPESFDSDGNWIGPTRQFWSEEDVRREAEDPFDDGDPLPPGQDDEPL